MQVELKPTQSRIDRFFSGPAARADRWRDLLDAAQAWLAGSGKREQFEAALADLGPTEEFHAYPGLHLMAALRDCAASDDARATVALVQRISTALITRSFRRNSGDWNVHDDGEADAPDMLPSTLGHADTQKPYFETLIVTGVPADRWSGLCAEWRRLRRPLDAFIYEPVLVGSVEDAFCAIMLNPDLASVVINEGFVFRSRHDVPVLRTVSQAMEQKFKTELSALRLAEFVKRVRPELDLYHGLESPTWKSWLAIQRPTSCAASSIRWKNCSSCTSPCSKAFRIASIRRSSTI